MFYLLRGLLFIVEYLIILFLYTSFFQKKEKKSVAGVAGLAVLTVMNMYPVELQLINILFRIIITWLIGFALFDGQKRMKGLVAISASIISLLIETVVGLCAAPLSGIDATKLDEHTGVAIIALTAALFLKYICVWAIRKTRKATIDERTEDHTIFTTLMGIPLVSLVVISGAGYYLLTMESPDLISFYIVIALMMLINLLHYNEFRANLKLLESQID